MELAINMLSGITYLAELTLDIFEKENLPKNVKC